jgi:hypothetical protein
MRDDRGRALRDLPAPELWPTIERGLADASARPSLRPRTPWLGGGRVTAAVVAFAVALAGTGLAWLAFGRGSEPSVGREPPLPKMKPITVQASFDAQARCSATLLTPAVRPGQRPVIRYRLTNDGAAPLRYGYYLDFPSVTDRSGATVYTWGDQYGGVAPSLPGPGLSETLQAQHSIEQSAPRDIPVIRWPGPLALHLTCPFVTGTQSHRTIHIRSSPTLPPLPLLVFAPGPASTSTAAIAGAVSASGGLFSNCQPKAVGEAVVGHIAPPKVAHPFSTIAPLPMLARCWASVEREKGFDVVTLVFVSPPDVRIRVPSPGSRVTLPDSPSTLEVVRWLFVVTPWSSTPALGPLESGRSATPTLSYSFNEGRWTSAGASCVGGVEWPGGSGGVTFPVAHKPC